MERPRGPISAARQRGGSDNDRPSRRARAFAGLAAIPGPEWGRGLARLRHILNRHRGRPKARPVGATFTSPLTLLLASQNISL